MKKVLTVMMSLMMVMAFASASVMHPAKVSAASTVEILFEEFYADDGVKLSKDSKSATWNGIAYDFNGGKADWDSAEKCYILQKYISGAPADSYFLDRWNTKADGSGTDYEMCDEISESKAKKIGKLYAIWYNDDEGYEDEDEYYDDEDDEYSDDEDDDYSDDENYDDEDEYSDDEEDEAYDGEYVQDAETDENTGETKTVNMEEWLRQHAEPGSRYRNTGFFEMLYQTAPYDIIEHNVLPLWLRDENKEQLVFDGIRFDPNGGDFGIHREFYEFNAPETAEGVECQLDHWNTEPDDSGESFALGEIVEDHKIREIDLVYAIWSYTGDIAEEQDDQEIQGEIDDQTDETEQPIDGTEEQDDQEMQGEANDQAEEPDDTAYSEPVIDDGDDIEEPAEPADAAYDESTDTAYDEPAMDEYEAVVKPGIGWKTIAKVDKGQKEEIEDAVEAAATVPHAVQTGDDNWTIPYLAGMMLFAALAGLAIIIRSRRSC